jgi:hypothetical protein
MVQVGWREHYLGLKQFCQYLVLKHESENRRQLLSLAVECEITVVALYHPLEVHTESQDTFGTSGRHAQWGGGHSLRVESTSEDV